LAAVVVVTAESEEDGRMLEGPALPLALLLLLSNVRLLLLRRGENLKNVSSFSLFSFSLSLSPSPSLPN
jgi:hypothetical protein